MVPINLGTLQDYVDMGRIIPQANPDDPPLTIKDLVAAGMLKNSTIKHGVKLLAKGKERLRTPLRIEISRASSDAITALESVGGQVTTVHYNKLALRTLLKPHKFEGKIMPKRASPPPKLMTYYTNHEKRGYLSPESQLKKVRSQLINENASM
jgi:large subunit ribosomal protein L15